MYVVQKRVISAFFSGAKEEWKIADTVIHKIENLTKIEAILASIILTLVGLVAQKLYMGEPIPVELIFILALFLVLLIIFQLLYYLKFIVEKEMWLREQKVLADIQNSQLVLQIKKLSLDIELKKLEV